MRKLFLLAAVLVGLFGTPAWAETASDRLAAPGPEHAWMEPLVGQWTVAMRVWPGAGAEPFDIPGMTANREMVLGGRYLHEVLVGSDGVAKREATLGFNRLDGRFELVTVDSFEPGQMVYLGRGDEAAESMSLFGESTEAGMGAEPTGRRRDLRFSIVVESADANVQRICVRYPGGEEYLFVEQRFTRRN
ncbi:MAG: DUF1579 family protein [Devosia sp.]